MADLPAETRMPRRCAECLYSEWVKGRPRPGGAQQYLWCDSCDEWTEPDNFCELWEPKDA